MPTETDLPSVNARTGSWQVLQATVPSADKRPSKNSCSPRAIFSGVCGLSAGMAARVASGGTPVCPGDFGRANEPAGGIRSRYGVVCGPVWPPLWHPRIEAVPASINASVAGNDARPTNARRSRKSGYLIRAQQCNGTVQVFPLSNRGNTGKKERGKRRSRVFGVVFPLIYQG